MPRNMSFSKTKDQMYCRIKTVTRRFGWEFLKAGDILNAVEKGMGLKKGEKVKRICQIRVIRVDRIPAGEINNIDCAREGFPNLTPAEFLKILFGPRPVDYNEQVTRIEFEYVD